MAEKVPGPPVIDSSLQGLKRWQLERQLLQHYHHRGSRYPPFSIEPVPYVVQRTSRLMTDEERFLRKQWLKDQILAADEPRFVPEAHPNNRIRTFYKRPWNAIEGYLAKNVMNRFSASLFRKCSSLFLGLYAGTLFVYYQTRYTHNTWEKHCGVRIYGERRVREGDDTVFPEEPDFGMGRFKEREYQNK